MVLLYSLVFGMTSVFILAAGVPDCSRANLKFATLLTFVIHLVILVMMLMQYLSFGSCLQSMPSLLGVFYVFLVFVMFMVQYFLFDSSQCYYESTVLYIWLLTQVVVFYLIVACGLATWGAFICWHADEEDLEMQEVYKYYAAT